MTRRKPIREAPSSRSDAKFLLRASEVGTAVGNVDWFEQFLQRADGLFRALEAYLPAVPRDEPAPFQTPVDFYFEQMLLITAADCCELAEGLVHSIKMKRLLTALALCRALLERVAMTRLLCARFEKALHGEQAGESLDVLYVRVAFSIRAKQSSFVGPFYAALPPHMRQGREVKPFTPNVLSALDEWNDSIQVVGPDGSIAINSVRDLYDQISEHVHPNAQWYWRRTLSKAEHGNPNGSAVLFHLAGIAFTTASFGLRGFPAWWALLPEMRNAVALYMKEAGREIVSHQFGPGDSRAT